MNTPLRDLLHDAESRLDPASQRLLADLIADFVAAQSDPPRFTAAERAHLALLDTEPFDPADPAEVHAAFHPTIG